MANPRANSDETTRGHIDLLLLVLASEASDKGRVATKLIASGLVTFENAWMVYKPRDLIYASSYGQDRLYTLNQAGYHKDNCVGKYFQLSCTFSACDGEKSGASHTTLRIVEREEFVGNDTFQYQLALGFSIEVSGRRGTNQNQGEIDSSW